MALGSSSRPAAGPPVLHRLQRSRVPGAPDRDRGRTLVLLRAYRNLHRPPIGLGRPLVAAPVEIDEERVAVRTETGAGEFNRVAEITSDIEDLSGRRNGAHVLRRGGVLAKH